jgi:hypothetical protein
MKSLLAYKQIRNQIKTGDMLEWRSRSALGYVIRFFSGKDKNHTSLCVDLKEYANYQYPHKFVLEAEPNGIELNLISRLLEEYSGSVWWSPLRPEFDSKRDLIAQWALEKAGIKYDYKGLFKNIFGHVSADARHFFCSEFRFIVLVAVGILPQYTYDSGRKIVVDTVTGKPVKAPRPGEFKQYDIDLPAVQIL